MSPCEGIKYLCRQCGKQFSQKGPLNAHKRAVHEGANTLVGNVTIKQLKRETLLNIKGQYMMGSNTLVGNATIKQQQKEVSLNTKGQYMKESSILADNATIKQFQRAILLDIKGQHMQVL